MKIYLLFFGIVLLSSIAVAQQDPIFFADFNNCTDGDDGSCEGFSPITGNWAVLNKEYKQNSGSEDLLTLVNGFYCDNCSIRATLKNVCSWARPGIIFRYKDFNNYYGITLTEQDKQVNFWEKIQGGYTVQSSNVPLTCGKDYNLTVVQNGNDLTVFLDNDLIFSSSISKITSGQFGLWVRQWGGNNIFDDFIVFGQVFSPFEICNDNIDNDGDGLIDCKDIDCNGVMGNGGMCEYGSELTCNDQFDNDADWSTDCLDIDCTNSTYCIGPKEICNDGLDNDNDNLVDCNDILDCGGYCIAQLQTQNQQLQQQVNQNKGFINNLIKKVNEIVCYLKLGPCVASNTVEEKTT